MEHPRCPARADLLSFAFLVVPFSNVEEVSGICEDDQATTIAGQTDRNDFPSLFLLRED